MCTSLRMVNLYENKMGRVGGLALIESFRLSKTITEINLSRNNLGDEFAIALAEMLLHSNTVLQKVDVSSTGITTVGGLALVEAITFNNTLIEIDLSGILFESKLALAFAEMLKSNSVLQIIKIKRTEITLSSALQLVEALEVNYAITEIELSGKYLGDPFALALAEVLKSNKTLTSVNLSGCNITYQGAAGIVEALTRNTSVTKLFLDWNRIGDDTCVAIGGLLKVNNTLKRIELGHCSIRDEGAIALAAGLLVNSSVKYMGLAEIYTGTHGAWALVAMMLCKKDKNLRISFKNPKQGTCVNIVERFGINVHDFDNSDLFYQDIFSTFDFSSFPRNAKYWFGVYSSPVVFALENNVDKTLECLRRCPERADEVLVERYGKPMSIVKSGLLYNAIQKERRENAARKSTSRAGTEAIEAAVAVASAIKGAHDTTLVNIHLCGDGCAGKSMTKRALQSTLNIGWMRRTMLPAELKNVRDVEGATLGSVSEPMDCMSAGGKAVRLLLHDYGGQEAFQVNHAPHLSAPSSAYIVVVALCDASTAAPYVPFSRAHILERYTAWLKFIYSAVPAGTFPHCVTVINFIQQFQQATSNFTLEDVVADITAVQAAWTSKGKLNFQERPPLQLDVNVPRQAYDILTPVLKSVVGEVSSASIPVAPCLQALRAAMADEKEWPLFSYEPELYVKIRKVVAFRFTPSITIAPSIGTREKIVDTITSITQSMLEAHRDIIVLSLLTGERISINRPNWLTNKLLGSLFDPLHRKHIDKARPARATNGSADPSHLLSVSDIQAAVSVNLDAKTRSMVDDSFIPKLLQHVGVCIPVVVDGGGFVQGVAEGEDAAAVEHWFPAFSITPMKEADGAVLDYADHIVARLFRLKDPEFSVFPPGYFSSLFVSIVSLYNKTNSILIFKDGMELRTRAASSVALQQIVVRQSSDLLSFVVTVATAGIVGTVTGSGLAFMTMQKIKKFIFSENSWRGNVQVQECGLDPEDIARSSAIPEEVLVERLKDGVQRAENLVYYFGVERAISGRLNPHVIDKVLDKLLSLEGKVDLVLDSMQSFREELSESLTTLRMQISELQQLTWQSLQGLTDKLDVSLVRAEEARVETKQDLYTIIDSLASNLLSGLVANPAGAASAGDGRETGGADAAARLISAALEGPFSDFHIAISQSASATMSQLQDMKMEMLREVCKLSEDLHDCVFDKLLAAVEARHTSAQQETRALFLTELNALHNAADASQEVVRAQVAALQAQLSTSQSIPQAMYTELLALRESVQAMRSVQLDSLYGVYDTPLLLSLTQPAAAQADSSSSSWDVKGRLQRGVYEVYRLHFVFPCCGNKAGEGYELKVTKGWVSKLSKVLRCTLTAIKVVSFFTPFPVPMLDKLAEYLPRDIGALDVQDLLEDAKKVVSKGKNETDKLLAHGCSKRVVDKNQSTSSTSSTYPPTPPPPSASDSTPAAIVESEPEPPVITMEHVASVLEVLQMVKETSPPRSTGLAVCRTSRGQCAWVCKGEGGADSACKTRFMAEGSECLAIKLTLG